MTFKMAGILLGLGIMLVGCSDTTGSKPVKEEAKAGAITTTSDPSPAQTKPDLTAQVKEYHAQLNAPIHGLMSTMEQFTELNEEASNTPSVMFTQDWKQKMAISLVMLDHYIDQIRQVDPPEELGAVHSIILQAMDEYQYVADNYADALDNLDATEVRECVAHMQQGNDYISQATDDLTGMVE